MSSLSKTPSSQDQPTGTVWKGAKLPVLWAKLSLTPWACNLWYLTSSVADHSVLSVFINLSIMLIASRWLWLYAVVSVWLSVLWIRYKSMGRDWDGGFGDQFLYNFKHFNVYLLNLLFTCRLQFVYISSYYLLVTSYLSQSISMPGKWINLFCKYHFFYRTGFLYYQDLHQNGKNGRYALKGAFFLNELCIIYKYSHLTLYYLVLFQNRL